MSEVVTVEMITSKIYLLRGVKVMLDRDLSDLYDVETKALKQAVRRNMKRFPPDFMFELTKDENQSLRSQNVTLKRGRHSKYLPFAFTEQGVAMLSSVLRSDRAIQVNIQIMRVFSRLRSLLLDNVDLRRELEEMRMQTEERFQIVFETLDQLMTTESKIEKKIGFVVRDSLKS